MALYSVLQAIPSQRRVACGMRDYGLFLAHTSLPGSAPLSLGLQKTNSRLTGATDCKPEVYNLSLVTLTGLGTRLLQSMLMQCRRHLELQTRTPELELDNYSDSGRLATRAFKPFCVVNQSDCFALVLLLTAGIPHVLSSGLHVNICACLGPH